MKALVLLGDVIASRKVTGEIDPLLDKLASIKKEINREFRKDLKAPFKMIKGKDEFGLVTIRPTFLYSLVGKIAQTLHPFRARYVVVEGIIDVGVASRDVAAMDGPAFHRAADIMAELKDSMLPFGLECDRGQVDRLVENQINLLLSIQAKWTEKQMAIFRLYQKMENQVEVAGRLGISQPAVSASLRAIGAYEIIIMEDRLHKAIESLYSR
ncbi:MAG TPA: SatD family protein [bacterium]|nr:SatD family protein [bacterium]